MMTMIPTPDEILVPDGLVKLANNQYPEDDDFTEVIKMFGDIVLTPMVLTAYFCENCGCRFMPDRDGTLWYRDRYSHVDSRDDPRCDDNSPPAPCGCHDIPYNFRPLPGHCATCETSVYEDDGGGLHHLWPNFKAHEVIHVVPVTEQDMDDLKHGLLRIEQSLTD